MPIYLFHCYNCDEDTDGIFPAHDLPEKIRCVHCGRKAAVRVYTAPSIHYKGSGWGGDYKRKKHHGAKTESSNPQEVKEKADAGKSRTPDKSA